MTVEQVAKRLVELCRQGKNLQAIEELYADDIVSVELMSMPDMPAEQRGKKAIVGKNQWWFQNHEFHGGSISDPLVTEQWFAIKMSMDVTAKQSGRRVQMSELGVYKVKDGKIVEERFFYES